ncbi:NTP pyrophosphohydrolase [Streptomyces kanamyceticus]|uniref:NTP pyrophosphohydrolase n=1 Tax=Streptomyces kanamyceticus TaxID=1967 RepID=UPI0037DCC244
MSTAWPWRTASRSRSPADGERWAVGAVILNRDGAAFARRRGPGRHLRRVRRHLGTTTWTGDDGTGTRHEADHLVEVDGDLDHPVLEWSKHTAYGWFGPDDLSRLKQNRAPGEYLIHDLIAKALQARPDQ